MGQAEDRHAKADDLSGSSGAGCRLCQPSGSTTDVRVLCSSPKQVVSVINEFREHANASHVALDRCPRCAVVVTNKATEFTSAARVIKMCLIFKATEIARCRLYLEHARSAARAGQLVRARDVALELVGHVTPEEPRSHLLLGKLAIQLKDKRLLREAK
jgi:hypothetical protein